ncbi:MAG: putative sulfate exporter family transporter [Actinomycetota bacterium]
MARRPKLLSRLRSSDGSDHPDGDDGGPVIDRRAVVAAVGTALPGLVLAFLVAIVARTVAGTVGPLSAAIVAVVLGLTLANLGLIPEAAVPGLKIASRLLLRIGVVLLGLRLVIGDIADIGVEGLLVVLLTVVVTFVGTQWLGRRLGLSAPLALLIATGYAICGVSAIAAIRFASDADDEEVALGMGLVTLFGTVALLTLPVAAAAFGLSDDTAGLWVGASVHDVAQVVATASAVGSDVLAPAVAVKLTRVALLAPLVLIVSLTRPGGGSRAEGEPRPRPGVPWFVTAFLVAVLIRSTGLLPDEVVSTGRTIEGWLLTTALVGLGAGIRIDRLVRLGLRPIAVGLVAWIVVAGVALGGAIAVG